MSGRVFEIREFTLHDGPGIRTTVFMKGCPLRCAWCHNPEGQSFEVETMRHSDGRLEACGRDLTPEELAGEVLANADIMRQSGGGVTFSGGEPLSQAEFLMATIELLKRGGVAVALETSGYAPAETYRKVVSQVDFVYQDLKHYEAAEFSRWCGGELGIVITNVEWLKTSGVRHVFRVPCIPGVNDSEADRKAFKALAGDSTIEFLPYNPAAGAKYPMLGRKYGIISAYR